MTQPADICRFWFEETDPKLHFVSTSAFDGEVHSRFAQAIEHHAELFDAGDHPWLKEPESGLALIMMFDQFTRNCFRGSGKSFEFDSRARAAARIMIERGLDMKLPEDRRAFIYLPFMHSEDLADQDYSVELFSTRLPEGNGNLPYAKSHRDTIREFGRFPYRNEAMGRTSTPEEAAWLERRK